jgi:hypothetical protein
LNLGIEKKVRNNQYIIALRIGLYLGINALQIKEGFELER